MIAAGHGSPKRRAIITSLFITIGLACAWYLFGKQAEIVSGDFFRPFEVSKWLNYLSATVVAAFAWAVIHGIYTTSFGLSLKSISLKDIQIAPAGANEDSILNRHLDEILYFFQTTKYDLVVIEDLDRFENPDIFVTLREINGLINASEGINRPVRFLYALRDDIFANTDRTKFFEFIVPVIPIINHSNSIDKVLEQVHRIELDARLNRQFLREVSRYLTDMRLIRNIFNEYVVYASNLKADGEGLLDPNKLLAVLIYKNVIPRDFAALHRQEGVLTQVLARYDQYIAKIEGEIRDKMLEIENDLEIGEAQALRDQSDLRKVYAMAVVERIPAGYHILQARNGSINLGNLAESDALEEIIAQKIVSVTGRYSSQQTVHFPDLEQLLDPTRSFEQRKAHLDRKSAKFKQSSDKRLRELKSDLASLRTRRFNEVVRESAELIDQVFAEVSENRELLRYLILEGYLDDTYYQYISLFHTGRLSPNDNNFLIRIRAYDNPPPDFPIDNTAEVIASMRGEDFGHVYVLNRFIVDHLLSHGVANPRRVTDAADFIAAHFRDCGEFFRSYYTKGAQVESFIHALSARWPGFAAVALDGTDGAPHAARILAYAPDRNLQSASTVGALKSFLSDNADQVLKEGIDFDIGRLRSLEIEIADVASLADFPTALSFVAKEGLYRISIDNIRHILGQVTGWRKMEDLDSRHFSTLREANDPALLKRIDADFPTYVSDVLLRLEANTDEDPSSISDVLAREEVGHDLRMKFLSKQNAVFPDFDYIPAAFHQVVLEEHKVEAKWENCIGFMNSPVFDAHLLTSYLNDSGPAAALSRQPIPADGSSLSVGEFVIGNYALSPDNYRSYVRQLPKARDEFPEVEATKIKILIEERKVTFSPTAFENLEKGDLQVLFVAMNFPAYEAQPGRYPIDDGFRAKLLRTGITDAQKLKLIADMDESYVASAPPAAADIGPLLDRYPIGKPEYGVEFIQSVIINSRAIKVQISLFNKLHPSLTVPQVREVLGALPRPFWDISAFGKSPKIENSDINRQFAAWLKDRDIISSFGNAFLGDEIKINTFRRPR